MQDLVSILIPVHQGEQTIGAALSSCLAQTYAHIEILVLDDASTDHTMHIAKSFDSQKISVISNATRKGIATSRNTLLQHARGHYIAWLDADDLMEKDRIEQQVIFMQNNPSLDIAGSWIRTDWKELPTKKTPLLHHQIRTMLWFKNCMIQPSVISRNFYRKEDIWYDTDFNNSAEDYELWYRLSALKKFANIPLFLTTYHMTVGDALKNKLLAGNFQMQLEKLWIKKWADAGIHISLTDKAFFQEFLYKSTLLQKEEAQSVLATLDQLYDRQSDGFYRLMISYHKLRLWKHMQWSQKLRYFSLFLNVVHYAAMKRSHIF